LTDRPNQANRSRNRDRTGAQRSHALAHTGHAPDRILQRPAARAATETELKAHFLAGALVFDQTGRLWVRMERGGLEDTIFDLFDPTGRFMGEIRVATRIGLCVIAHGFLAGITMDADEAQYVTLFRLVD
jgi:hypothetical protein